MEFINKTKETRLYSAAKGLIQGNIQERCDSPTTRTWKFVRTANSHWFESAEGELLWPWFKQVIQVFRAKIKIENQIYKVALPRVPKLPGNRLLLPYGHLRGNTCLEADSPVSQKCWWRTHFSAIQLCFLPPADNYPSLRSNTMQDVL